MDYRAQIQQIRYYFQIGAITYDEARRQVAPILREVNKKNRVIAKKHGKRYTDITFHYVFR